MFNVVDEQHVAVVQHGVCDVFCQGSHASWKVLDFLLDFPGPAKSWKISLVLESPGNENLRSGKVLENADPG